MLKETQGFLNDKVKNLAPIRFEGKVYALIARVGEFFCLASIENVSGHESGLMPAVQMKMKYKINKKDFIWVHYTQLVILSSFPADMEIVAEEE